MSAESTSLNLLSVEQVVRERYSQASQKVEPALCCAVTPSQPELLKVLPPEIIERDYGCGDPAKYVTAGETVLDLGSGVGKACYVAAQIVGAAGRVIGVDMNDDMLSVARKYQPEIAQKIGYSNVEFRRGRIQDLATDLDVLDAMLASTSVANAADWMAFEERRKLLAKSEPMIASESIDVTLSNCVLNLVAEAERVQLIAELYRVLRPGGRAVISDIVSSKPVPEHLKNNAELWSGCISGAFEQRAFVKAFETAGFTAVELLERQAQPWQVVEGIEFRSVTIRAYRPKLTVATGEVAYVTYRGPWRSVMTDDMVLLSRGEPMLVHAEVADRWMIGPLKQQLIVERAFFGGPASQQSSATEEHGCCGEATKCC
ncbi:Methyltransferase type 11 [Pirellula staleyi DSM 6068]|uniref:Arsenite methyltransferase n=1 Tax=Pirellula staleyi (strain ATCC 27377 / DSM 6068 / ICPB 4128) TaxID=530564 RepID=D2R0W8_PIRSD|nr:methyltransferase domain-containing protein [Pirellula staleyi]ADB18453.1 Methyltransferase type 11 [Pirellula staleyi DSM 6068]